MRITLKQLQVFTEVVKNQSVTLAAESLFLSQSAASTALSELETQLKTPLFSRLGKKLILNQQGTLLLPKAKEILNNISEIHRLFSSDVMTNSLSMSGSATICRYLLADIINDYLQQQPDTNISLLVQNPDQVVDNLIQFKIDIGFSEKFCHHADLETIPWYLDELAIFVAPSHELCKKKIISLQDLEAVPWILQEKSAGAIDLFESKIAPHFNKINVNMSIAHSDVIKHLVRKGLGISYFSTLTLRETSNQQDLVALHTPFLDLKRRFYILLRKNDTNPLLRAFLNTCQTYAQNI